MLILLMILVSVLAIVIPFPVRNDRRVRARRRTAAAGGPQAALGLRGRSIGLVHGGAVRRVHAWSDDVLSCSGPVSRRHCRTLATPTAVS